jgi:acylglycerol lipase
MDMTSGELTGARGLSIRYRTWVPAAEPAGSVVIAHGFAEHSGRYEALAGRLTAQGYAVRVPDHRGHGLSEGKRTSLVSFDDYVADLAAVIDTVRQEWPAVPLFLLGHSMGGLIALAYAVDDGSTLRGLVVSAPAACAGDVSPVRVAVGRLVARIAPDARVLKLPLERISRDPRVVEAYNSDPLVFRMPLRARLGAEMLSAMGRVDGRLPALRLPLLVMQGTLDGLVDPGCGPHVFERAGSPDKTLKMYDGLWHEIFNEPERDAVISDLTTWLNSHH